MLTRCPACETHFRVTPEQLKLRAGKVRCGECQRVFNALDSLIEEAAILPAPDPAAPPVPELRLPKVTLAPERQETAELPAPTVDAPGETIGARELPALPDVAKGAPTETGAANPDAVESWDDILPDPPAPRRRWPWVVGSLAALLALAAQAGMMYRVEIAVIAPELRPVLEAVCEPLGCRIGLPAKVALVGIESSDLHPDGTQKGRLVLSASLRNRAPFAQAFPNVELTLTDVADKPVLRKVLAPADYLPRATTPASGMPPHAEIAINLALDAGTVGASGYRLYIFYP